MTRYDGPRSYKLTILIPDALRDDLHALRLATMQSTGDLINKLLEAHIEANPRDLADGRRLAEAEAARIEARKAREASTPDREDRPIVLPSLDDVRPWIDQPKEQDKRTRREKDAKAFLEWCEKVGRTCIAGDAEAFIEAVLSKQYTDRTLRDHSQRVRSLEKYVIDSRLRRDPRNAHCKIVLTCLGHDEVGAGIDV